MAAHRRIVVGERSGSRAVVAIDPSGTSKHMRFLVRCDCGTEQVVSGTTFRSTSACKKCNRGGAKRKYGNRVMQQSKLYHSWIAMRRRCDPTVDVKRNERWAGRGIKVCAEWQDSFEVFEAWSVSHGYRAGLSLDRVDNDADYTPGNCEWVTRSENSKRCRALYSFARMEAQDGRLSGLLSFGA